MCVSVCVRYLQSLGVSVFLLLLLQQLLNVCVQLLRVCVCFLLQVCVASLLFLQTLLQDLDLVLLNEQLSFLQRQNAGAGSEVMLAANGRTTVWLPWQRCAPPAPWR